MHKMSLRTHADIVAAAAPIIGFAPTNSIVAYMLRNDPVHGTVVLCGIRFDVTITLEQAANLPQTINLTRINPDAAILLAICDAELDEHAHTVLDTLRDALNSVEIPVTRRIMTRDVTTPGTWHDIDTGQHGPTYPYTDSELAAQTVAAGATIGRSRQEIIDEFSVTDRPPLAAIGEFRHTIRDTIQEIAEVLDGTRKPRADLAIRAGLAITTHRGLRDIMLQQALDHEHAASQLWTRISRQLRGCARAEALTVAAVCYCLHNDSVRAGIALELVRGLARDGGAPMPPLAEMLDQALQSGMHPNRIRDVIADLPPTLFADDE